MASPAQMLNQVTALTQNPSGLNQPMSEAELAIQDAQEEAEYQRQRAEQMAFAYGQQGGGRGGPSMLPDEKQFKFMFSVQPKVEDEERNAGWTTASFLESEILRHVQFSQFTPAEANMILDEVSDLQCMMSQAGTRDVVIQEFQALYARILIGKSTIHEGKPTTGEMVLAPVSKSENTLIQKQPQQKRTGFFSFLGGKR